MQNCLLTPRQLFYANVLMELGVNPSHFRASRPLKLSLKELRDVVP